MASQDSQIVPNTALEVSAANPPVLRSLAPVEPSAPLQQSDVLAFLQKRDSYGLGEPIDRVDRVQYVMFMAGPFCFKMRRQLPMGQQEPLNLEQRYRLACKEMRLGKVFAPELYLDLVPVRRYRDQLFLHLPHSERTTSHSAFADAAARAPVVEWLIMIRRYDFSKSYDKQVEIYQPNFNECQRLADLIRPDRTDEQWSKPAVSWLSMLDELMGGFAPVVRQLDREAKKPTMRACLTLAKSRLERIRPMIEQRGEKGLIGQIHGNVRLSNVVEVSDGLRLVNPQISQSGNMVREWVGDPLYDLASLVDELWSRGLARQANWVFSHYGNGLLNSHGLDGLQTLDVYLFVRAMERVSFIKPLLAKRNPADPIDDGCHQQTALAGYVKTARDSLVNDEAQLIVVGGSRRASRSHLARLLAPVIGRMPGALYLSAQQELLTLYEVTGQNELPQSACRQSVWRLVYRRLADKARQALGAGYSVILEGHFDGPDSRQILSALSLEKASPHPIIAFHLFDPTADAKDNEKSASYADNPYDLEYRAEKKDHTPKQNHATQSVEGILAQPSHSLDWTQWIELDASRSVGDLLSQALGHINPAWVPESKDTLH